MRYSFGGISIGLGSANRFPTPVLSDPRPEDGWSGDRGFIHEVLLQRYLAGHSAPEECEYYLCGPPLMIHATRQLLDELGVPCEHVHFDDFGGQ